MMPSNPDEDGIYYQPPPEPEAGVEQPKPKKVDWIDTLLDAVTKELMDAERAAKKEK